MRKARFTEEQIIRILRAQEGGMATADVWRKHGISNATYYKWKAGFGGMDVSDARKLKQLEDENDRRNRASGDFHRDRSGNRLCNCADVLVARTIIAFDDLPDGQRDLHHRLIGGVEIVPILEAKRISPAFHCMKMRGHSRHVGAAADAGRNVPAAPAV